MKAVRFCRSVAKVTREEAVPRWTIREPDSPLWLLVTVGSVVECVPLSPIRGDERRTSPDVIARARATGTAMPGQGEQETCSAGRRFA
jgi:hypothetical protein